MKQAAALNVLVLAGGPDRERPVSLQSGAQVADALRQAGHRVTLGDVMPDDFSAVDTFSGDVVFPVLHGGWGEGGGLQQALEKRGVCYVGCKPDAAALCMDKIATKQLAQSLGLGTPAFEVVGPGDRITLQAPLVIKAVREGSSIDLAICRDHATVDAAYTDLIARHDTLLVEQFITGPELTAGVIGTGATATALPVIRIVPATDYYDYAAKYERDDTQYLFDVAPEIESHVQAAALKLYEAACVRHLGRVDFMLDETGRPWLIEVNTLPGFTSHSLLPMAARQHGLTMPKLVDQLARLALTAD